MPSARSDSLTPNISQPMLARSHGIAMISIYLVELIAMRHITADGIQAATPVHIRISSLYRSASDHKLTHPLITGTSAF